MKEAAVLVRCQRCGTRNRIPESRSGQKARCGKCHDPIAFPGVFQRPVEITDAGFKEEVLAFPGAVLVDFWAPWCGPCKMLTPVLDQLSQDYAGRIKVVKMNVDENPITASRFTIRSIPALLFFKNGNLVNSLTGARSKSELEQHIKALI